MPGPARRRGQNLLKAIKESNNDPEILEAVKTGARHVLELIARTGKWGRFGEEPEVADDKPEHRALIRKAGSEGIVLLKNENNVLPISTSIKKIAWIGPNANECIAGGGGSANLNPHYLTNPLDSIRAAVKEHNIEVNHETGCQTEKWVKTFPIAEGRKLPDMGDDNLDFASAVGIRLGVDLVRDVQEHINRAAALAKESDVAVVVVGMNNEWESEGYDRHSMALPGKQNELISAIAKVNPRTIIVNQSGCAVNMPWLEEVQGLLQVWYQGQEAGNALADVLLGKQAPGGRLPISFPKRVEDNSSWGNFGDGGEKNEVQYSEGIFVGYRHYVTRDIPVLFPFGYGLSYTTFSISAPEFTGGKNILAPGVTATVEVCVKNTGKAASSEMVQVYISPRAGSSVERPAKELKGFGKVELAPGEEKVVKVVLDEYAVGYFETKVGKWRAEKGTYEVTIGRNVEDVVGSLEVVVDQTYEWIF
ncbi:hypothetical protein L873DRAFT_1683653 [Choiromyces venosus 120613-1]|uniref:beta-glucosidase n=1 Tax=Choiromyces venosus 120613-1 TaxID=1336337 RepID=A0A3N4JMJ4_9PEZI|nr:hypothetical protein L873DRAFT_1683653 [Choiromyces venosus 120613-1]